MKSPFKFLDAYTLEDKEEFFGRDKEMEELYEMVFKSPMVLVYGMSGTGKTSLIQCGLASRFEGPDWYPFMVRRQSDINVSLRGSLKEALGDQMKERLVENIGLIFRYYLRPVYLIFDQLEELFILGSIEEQQQFIESLRELLDADLACRIIFVMREEYIGQLYHFEKTIPTLFDFRLRVEAMKNAKVQEVMLESFKKFNITLEPTEEERCEQMLDYLSAGKSGIQLPYLQVYLDTLYRSTYQEIHGNEILEKPLRPLEFTKAKIDELGRIEEVLEQFLVQQEVEIQRELESQFSNLPEQFTRNLLDIFVTEEGTKQPIPFTREQEVIRLNKKFREQFSNIPEITIQHGIEAFERSRILRIGDDSIELAHDSLAMLIDEKRTDEQRQLNEIKRRVRSAHFEYLRAGEYLSAKQLAAFEEYLPQLSLAQDEWQFIEDSRTHLNRTAQEEKERQARELQLQRKHQEAQAKRRQALIFMSILGVLTLIAIGAGLFARANQVEAERQEKIATEQKQEAETQRGAAEEQRSLAEQTLEKLKIQILENAQLVYENHLNKATAFEEKLAFGEAVQELKDAQNSIQQFVETVQNQDSTASIQELRLAIDNGGERAATALKKVRSLLAKKPTYERRMKKGAELWNQNLYEEALEQFRAARQTGIGVNALEQTIRQVREQGAQYYQELGDVHFGSSTNAGYRVAKTYYLKVQTLTGNTSVLEDKIKECDVHIK